MQGGEVENGGPGQGSPSDSWLTRIAPPVFSMEPRILKGLRGRFSEVRIPKDLAERGL
jgi:hypothetical protein